MNKYIHNDDKNEEKLKSLENIAETTRRIKLLAEDLTQLLKARDDAVLDVIKPIVEPRRNACAVLGFYSQYLDANTKFDEFNKAITNLKLDDRCKRENVEIEYLHKANILGLLETQFKTMNDLGNYKEIEIVKKTVKDHTKRIDNVLEIIKNTVMATLERLPKVVENIDLFSKFLLKHTDTKKYLQEYTEICHSRLGFFGIKDNKNAILQQTKNLTEYFNMIKELNTRILGKTFSKKVNSGLIQLIVLDLKNIIGTYLMKINKNQSPSYIPFLIQLYSRIRHSDGNMVEEIEELFELKPEIMKIMFNCFIQFFGELDLLNSPRKDLTAEKLTKILSEILCQFRNNKEVKREWCSTYGSSFGVYRIEDVDSNFSEKCLLKITELGKLIDAKKSSIYMLNNIHYLREYFVRFSGLDTKQLVYKYCENIVGFLRIGLESQTQDSIQEYLKTEIVKMKRYFLPEEERKYVTDKMRTLVEDLVSRKVIQGNVEAILEDVSRCFGNDTINK